MVMQRFSLEGKVAVVTGAASLRGIGRAIALTLAEAGSDVAVCDFKVKGEDFDLDGTAQEIKKLGRRCLAAKTDVSKESDVARFLEMVVGELGTVDIMVNNAGHVGVAPFLQLTESLWDEVMGVNVKGVLFGSKAAAKIMMERNQANSGVWAEVVAQTSQQLAHQDTYDRLSVIQPVGHELVPWPSLIFGVFSISIWYNALNQFMIQRVLGARNSYHARMGIVLAGFIQIILPVIIVLPGLILFAQYPEIMKLPWDKLRPQADKGWVFLVHKLIPVGLKGLHRK